MARMFISLLTCSFLVYSCADKKEKPEQEAEKSVKAEPAAEPTATNEPAKAEARSCKEEAADLRAFLSKVVDENAEVEAPWPTGDAALDAWIEEARAKLREDLKPDPAKKQKALSDGVDTSVDEETYRDCPQGLAALQAVGTVEPSKRKAALVAIADGVEACGCKVKIAQLKAAYYMGQRGPD